MNKHNIILLPVLQKSEYRYALVEQTSPAHGSAACVCCVTTRLEIIDVGFLDSVMKHFSHVGDVIPSHQLAHAKCRYDSLAGALLLAKPLNLFRWLYGPYFWTLIGSRFCGCVWQYRSVTR